VARRGAAFPAAAAGIAAAGYGGNALATVAGFLLLWFGAELGLAYRAGWRRALRYALALPVRDLLLPVLWVAALSRRDFVWRGIPITAGRRPAHRPVPHTATRPADETSGSF
jgi:ceramide glucosyltransferase